jgi:hypothetical protein
MFRKFGSALLAIIGMLAAGIAGAGPLTFYTDQTVWSAAVSGFNVGAYPNQITRSDHVDTIKITGGPAPGFKIVDQSSSTTRMGFTDLQADDFSFASPCEFDLGCLISAIEEVLVTFDTPIMGFATSPAEIWSDGLTVNGLSLAGLDGCCLPSGGFFGIVGPISSLDFVGNFSDEIFEGVFFSNVVVATVDEPSAFASLMAGLMPLAVGSPRFLRRFA